MQVYKCDRCGQLILRERLKLSFSAFDADDVARAASEQPQMYDLCPQCNLKILELIRGSA